MRPPTPASWRDYVRMARPDHWVKHIFIVPGIILAWILTPHDASPRLSAIVVGLAAAALAASANYVLNEWLDAESDRHHPTKSARPAVSRSLSPSLVWLEYVALGTAALLLSLELAALFSASIGLFLFAAVLYNVRPIRTKDRPYLDVLSEAINNPLRLVLGWAMISGSTLPPASLLLGYWMTGAFLMGVKRLAEYRTLLATVGAPSAALYRRSFAWYSENRLLVGIFLYAQLAAFFLAVFLIKYRVEYLLSLPIFALWFASYVRLGLKPDSSAQTPERLFRERALIGISALLVGALLVLTWVDLPALQRLTAPHFIEVPRF